MIRFPAREVIIGHRPLGGRNPIRLQSMTTTAALNIQGTVRQTIRIFEAGADYVRISTPNRQSVLNLEKIRKELHKAGFDQPLIADIHFNPDLALMAARLVEKVRINPGNFIGPQRNGRDEWNDTQDEAEILQIQRNIAPLLKVCKEYGTAIRIGTNFGSLSPRIIARYGNTPEGMVQSTIEFLRIFEAQGFFNTIISLKASNPLIMIQSYLLMVERMLAEGMNYPLHLGVTEAGEGENGRIKSALGITTLLQKGIGDTIRVSLSEEPEAEVPVARKIAEPFQDIFTRQPDSEFSFHTRPLKWQHENSPLLPGVHRALVVQTDRGNFRSDIHFHPNQSEVVTFLDSQNRADLIFFKEGEFFPESNSLIKSPGRILEVNTGTIFPVFKESELLSADYKPHPRLNFVYLSGSLQNFLIEKLQTIPGLIILWDPGEEDFRGTSTALQESLKSVNIIAAVIPRRTYHQRDTEDLLLQLTADFGRLLLEREIQGLWIENHQIPQDTVNQICFGLLQATGLRITKTEFISCPTCARTSFNLLKVLKEIKERTSDMPGLKIAVMGCAVNGPGEMADADFGIMGAGANKVHIFKGKHAVIKDISQNQAADALFDLITQLKMNKLK